MKSEFSNTKEFIRTMIDNLVEDGSSRKKNAAIAISKVIECMTDNSAAFGYLNSTQIDDDMQDVFDYLHKMEKHIINLDTSKSFPHIGEDTGYGMELYNRDEVYDIWTIINKKMASFRSDNALEDWLGSLPVYVEDTINKYDSDESWYHNQSADGNVVRTLNYFDPKQPGLQI